MAGNSCLNPGIENKHVSNPPLSDFSPTWGKIRVLPGRDGQADTFEWHRSLWMVAGRVTHTTVWGEILLFGHAQNLFMALNFQFMPGVGSLLEEDLRNSSIRECSSLGGSFEHGSFMAALECLDLWFPVEFRLFPARLKSTRCCQKPHIWGWG